MAIRSFAHRAETFGYDTDTPWAADAFALLFSVPRLYRPLLESWNVRYPGTRRAVERLTKAGFVTYQDAILVDVRTQQTVSRIGMPVARYRLTAKGRRLLKGATEDQRVLLDEFPKLTTAVAPKLTALLSALDLEPPHSRFGLSIVHAAELAAMPDRSGRWWINHLVGKGLVTRLDERLPDAREVVPPHWRPTRTLCRQLEEVIDAFPTNANATLKFEYRLNRTRFLDDIDPARVGISGATDFDHDIECQRILAALLRSPRCAPDGVFVVEPRITLPVDPKSDPWVFPGPETVFYQPDAELRERTSDGRIRRSVVEYERFQSRRDAWSHIERFLGWLQERSLPSESAVLRFVVDSEPRVRSYVDLIEAFADYLIDHPDRVPANEVTLAVSSAPRVLNAADPLDDRTWFRILLPEADRSDTARRPVLHMNGSPYDDYFSRS